MFLSPPTAVIRRVPTLLADESIRNAFKITISEIVISYCIAIVLGSLFGLLLGLNNKIYDSLNPIISLAYAVPKITVLPIIVLLFGIGVSSKIIFGVIHAVFPIYFNITAGLFGVDRVLLKSAKSMGASRIQIIRKVILPGILPAMFTGLRLAMSSNLLGVLLAELYVSMVGLGYYINLFTESFDPTNMLSIVVILVVLVVVLNELLRRLELRGTMWKE